MFNRKKYIADKQKEVKKLVEFLKTKKIEFKEDNSGCDNVIFYNKEKTFTIAHYCFYKISGPCVTDEVWINGIMKTEILKKFGYDK